MRNLWRVLCALALTALPATSALAYLINVHETTADLTTLAQGEALIAATTPTFSAMRSIIELDDLGDGTRGHFALNQPFPGGANTTFAAHVTGNFLIPTAGSWTFGINHDDGARLTIDGVLVAVFPGLTDNRDTLLSAVFTAGIHSVDITFFERAGGASLEFFGAPGVHTAFNQNFFLIQSVPEPGILALLALGLLGFGLTGGARRSDGCLTAPTTRA